ncbi:MAG: hypothetical protein P4L22_07690 [Candidatus Babeliales bacterium]|nr:hypothetical protein [Candidatus Babeliales bacterium]
MFKIFILILFFANQIIATEITHERFEDKSRFVLRGPQTNFVKGLQISDSRIFDPIIIELHHLGGTPVCSCGFNWADKSLSKYDHDLSILCGNRACLFISKGNLRKFISVPYLSHYAYLDKHYKFDSEFSKLNYLQTLSLLFMKENNTLGVVNKKTGDIVLFEIFYHEDKLGMNFISNPETVRNLIKQKDLEFNKFHNIKQN